MEWVYGIEMCIADITEERFKGGIVVGSELLQAGDVVHEVGAHEGAPVAAIDNVCILPSRHP